MASNDEPRPAPQGSLRRGSISQGSETSQTAQEFITSQLQLEADARDALPYQFDTCTRSLGPLRQSLYSCLTCNPPPDDPSEAYSAAGVCYACSISCHGEHELVELFARRNFTCDCGTTRMPETSPCSLQINVKTGSKGNVSAEEAALSNAYNHNFRNRFCGCGDLYDAAKERGTMFQCLGLGTVRDGGCGEDWWHPECLLGLPRDLTTEYRPPGSSKPAQGCGQPADSQLATIQECAGEDEPAERTTVHSENGESGVVDIGISNDHQSEPEEHPLPPGFPSEDDFGHLICYKCTAAFPWIKSYANASSFIAKSFAPKSQVEDGRDNVPQYSTTTNGLSNHIKGAAGVDEESKVSLKRKAEEEPEECVNQLATKRSKSESLDQSSLSDSPKACKLSGVKPYEGDKVSIFAPSDFRDHICRCSKHFALVAVHPQLLEEEDTYEPPVSESDEGGNDTASVGSRSLLDRGEAALSNMDRVRAIEGVMAYNHVRDKVKDFLKPFAESGTPVSAEHIKAYFAQLRGDKESARVNEDAGPNGSSGDGSDGRREQSGY